MSQVDVGWDDDLAGAVDSGVDGEAGAGVVGVGLIGVEGVGVTAFGAPAGEVSVARRAK